MTRRSALRFAIVAAVVAVLLVIAWVALPRLTGPAEPAGATRLRIATAPPGPVAGCDTALLAPARVATEGDALVLVAVGTGETLRVVWPAGFAAWLVDGRAVLVDPRGVIIGRDGDILDGLGGGTGADDAFHVCPFGILPAGG